MNQHKLAWVKFATLLLVLSSAPAYALLPDNCPTMPQDTGGNLIPQPAPQPAFNVNGNITDRTLVSGSFGTNDRDGAFSVQNGETIYVVSTPAPMIVPSGSPTPCPTPVWSPKFNPLAPASNKLALVTIYGTPAAFNSATFSLVNRNKNGDLTSSSPVTISQTVPAGLPAGVGPASIPNGTVGGYFTLTLPSGSSAYQSFAYVTPNVGDIHFKVSLHSVASNGVSKAFTDKERGTIFRPRLKFAGSAQAAVPANNCSSAITVYSVDGNGNPTNVMPGSSNIAKMMLSGAPADIFLDNKCVYPTTTMSMENPVPAPAPAGTRPSAAIAADHVTFYFKSKSAQGFPISAIYLDGSRQMGQISQVQSVSALAPSNMRITGPASVNQGDCTAALTVRLLDKYGNEAPILGSPKNLNLNAGSSVTFYRDAGCSSTLGSTLTIPANASNASFYLRDTAFENLKMSLSDTAPLGSQIQATSYEMHVLGVGRLAAASDPEQAHSMAMFLWKRLVGTPPTDASGDMPKVQQMANLIMQGKTLDAAHIATDQDNFYNITIKNVATPLSNRLYNSLESLNDFVTTWIGIVRDGHDARELLTGNHIYVGKSMATSDDQHCANSTVYKSGAHFESLTSSFTNLRTNLVPVRQCAYNNADFSADFPVLLNDAAGLLTTRAWGIAHLYQGTNRRAIVFALDAFLCKDIHDVADNSMPDWHIRRDVDRAPGGDPKVYTASCRSCHGGMDALGGAYSFFDSYPNPMGGMDDWRLFYVDKGGYGEDSVMSKMNKNNNVFPPGWVSGDDSWINFFTENKNKSLGWSAEVPSKGNGIHALGEMLANSQAFPACMAKRAFTEVCKRKPDSSEQSLLDDLSEDFQSSGYNMRRLFEKAASLSVCLGIGG